MRMMHCMFTRQSSVTNWVYEAWQKSMRGKRRGIYLGLSHHMIMLKTM
jgi:hypothetical protein